MKKPFFEKPARIFAHRGYSKEYPENTALAFEKAIALGADVIETDAHLTRDGHVVIVHDEELSHITDGKGNVGQLTLHEIKQLDAAYHFSLDGETYPYRGKGITIMTLEEMLDAFPEQRFNVDLKDNTVVLAEKFCDIVLSHKSEHRVLGASQHGKNLQYIRKRIPTMATSFGLWGVLGFYFLFRSGLLGLFKHFPGDALQIPEYIGPSHLANGALIRMAHERGIQVDVWTVNQERDMRRLLDVNVDGIVTDDVPLLQKVLQDYPLK
ncbi:MAG: glycerophosphodiester phosphodiesterase [Spirochaetota bacterium]|nr:glycerophosphodiester phosphodiesterase [Spirochaetota bacterium]